MSDEMHRQNDAPGHPEKGTVTRRQLLTAAAAATVALAIPAGASADNGPVTLSFPFFPPITSGSYTTESIQDILNAVVTVHYLAGTGATLTLASADALGLSGWQLSMQQAAAAREQYQIDFLTSLGAKPLATAFTFPPAQFSQRDVNFTTAEGAATIVVGLHMTAVRELAEMGQPEVAKWMYQMGTQVSEQRAIFRTLLALDGVASAIPPNNKAFATDLFLYTRDVIPMLTRLRLLGGAGIPTAYPGRDAVLAAAGPMASAIIQKQPNNAASTVVITGPTSVTGERV